jgi:hypothetical protein
MAEPAPLQVKSAAFILTGSLLEEHVQSAIKIATHP